MNATQIPWWTQITPEWLTAIGTTGAIVVVLFVAFLPSLMRYYNRPKFDIEFKNEEPFCRRTMVYSIPTGIGTVPAYWIRLRVRNRGRSIARGCEGKLVRITEVNSGKDRTDFDPVVLHWVGSTHNPIDINKGEPEYLDIMCIRSDDDKSFHIRAEEEEPRGINLTPPRQDYVLHIMLYGENVEPLQKSFHLKNALKYDQIQLSES